MNIIHQRSGFRKRRAAAVHELFSADDEATCQDRAGIAKVRKIYETARTPYQRLLQPGALNEAKRVELSAAYNGLNPVWLLKSD